MRRVLIALLMLTTAGCETISIATTKKIEPQAPDTDVGILQVIESPTEQRPLWGNDAEWLNEYCTTDSTSKLTEAIWVPIVVNLAIKSAGKAANQYIKGIKEKSSKSTKFRTVIESQKLANAACLVVYRGPEIKSDERKSPAALEPNAAMVMKVERIGHAVRLTPIYAIAKNSISMTKCANRCSTPEANGKISMSVAITAVAALPNTLRDVNLRDLGTATMTVKNLPLPGILPDPSQHPTPGAFIGAPSDIIAIPTPGVGVQLTVVMSEIGDTAGDPDIAEAEIQAAMESLSVGTEAELKAHYERKAKD